MTRGFAGSSAKIFRSSPIARVRTSSVTKVPFQAASKSSSLRDEPSGRGGQAHEDLHDLRLDRNRRTVHQDAVQVRLNETFLEPEIARDRRNGRRFPGDLRGVARRRGHRRSIDLAAARAGHEAFGRTGAVDTRSPSPCPRSRNARFPDSTCPRFVVRAMKKEESGGRASGRIVFGLRQRVSNRMKARHLWYHRMAEKGGEWRAAFLQSRPCDPAATLARLSGEPQPALCWFSRWIAIVTTPFKFLGISGWTDTGCSGRGIGNLVRKAQHSTDGFWTLDVALAAFAIDQRVAGTGCFLRIEVEPGTGAHTVCSERVIAARLAVRFAGPLLIDTDGPFLEVHPAGDFEVIG